MREYLAPSPRPVIITGALTSWPALGKWTPDYFGEHYGDVEVTIDGRTMCVRELAAAIRVSSPEHPAPSNLAEERGRLRAAVTRAYLGALGGFYSGLEFLNVFV